MPLPPPRYQQWFATVFLLIAWGIFAFLAVKTIQIIQTTPVWATMIFPNQIVQTQPINPQNQSQDSVASLSPITQSATIQSPAQSQPIAQNTSQSSSAVNQIDSFTPSTCRHSGHSQFSYIGQRGIFEYDLPLRIHISSAVSEYGFGFDAGTRFEIIGASRCGTPEGYSAVMLFLNVRILGVRGDYIGWIPESGYGNSGYIVYNVTPIQ